MNGIKLILIAAAAMLLVSCRPKTEVPSKKSPVNLLQTYFDREIKNLQAEKRSLNKIIQNNGKTEQVLIESPDWKKELAPFTEPVTGKRSFADAFHADSSSTGNKSVFHYTAVDERAEIKSLSVYKTGGVTDSIVIIKTVSNMYYSATDTLIYSGNGNYRINALNRPAIGKTIKFMLEGNSYPAKIPN